MDNRFVDDRFMSVEEIEPVCAKLHKELEDKLKELKKYANSMYEKYKVIYNERTYKEKALEGDNTAYAVMKPLLDKYLKDINMLVVLEDMADYTGVDIIHQARGLTAYRIEGQEDKIAHLEPNDKKSMTVKMYSGVDRYTDKFPLEYETVSKEELNNIIEKDFPEMFKDNINKGD